MHISPILAKQDKIGPDQTPVWRATLAFVGLVILAQALLGARPAWSENQNSAHAGAYLQELPSDRPYNLYVFGDSFAAEMADGVKWAMRENKRVVVRKSTKAATGLVRNDIYDWLQVVSDIKSREQVDIAVISIGGNDRQDIRVDGRRLERFTPKWREEYMKRIDRMADLLQKDHSAVYWVSLPNVRSKRMSKDYRHFNSYFRQVAAKRGIEFIDITKVFLGKDGGYTPYGKGLNGRITRLRDADGVHLTSVGAKLLGRFVAKRIRADIDRATASNPVGQQ